MKKILLLTLSALILLTACTPAKTSSREDPDLDLEKLTDGVYADYDRSKFENVSAPKAYYAEYVTLDDSDLIPFFSAPPQITPPIYDGDRDRRFENGGERGSYGSHGSMFFGSECWNDFSVVFKYRFAFRYEPSVEELDFMPLSELYERFENDANKFVTDVRIHDMLAVTAEEFAETTAVLDRIPDPERGWSEPKDFYYIRARQFVNDIPIFAGISQTNIETLFYAGSEIEACYSEDGMEHFSAIGLYSIGEEAPVDGTFIDLGGAEQIIRDEYVLPYGYDYEVLIDCDLVYVAVFEGGRTVLTPAWEFYYDQGEQASNSYITSPWIRINAYTGEFMR